MAIKQTYTELSGELQQVMAKLEQGELDIDEAVRCYERGLAIVKQLEDYLQTAENKVTELKASVLGQDDEE